MKSFLNRAAASALSLLLLSGAAAAPAFAHSTVDSTQPASGSILPESPEAVTITFNEEARLTAANVEVAGEKDRKLSFTPSGSSTTFTLTEPALVAGRNEITWKALSKDGHAIEGSIIIVIKPGATPSAPAPSADHKHHH